MVYNCECGYTTEIKQAYCGHCSKCRVHLGDDRYERYINLQKTRTHDGHSDGSSEYSLKTREKMRKEFEYREVSEFVDDYKCPVCKEWFNKYSIRNHIRLNHTEEGTKEKELHSKKMKEVMNKESVKEKLSILAKKNGFGGKVEYKIPYKRGRYKGIWCDSSYELAYLMYCIDKCIPIQRNEKFFIYEYNGKKHKYYPDFIVNGNLVEIKGFIRGIDKAKFKSVHDKGIELKVICGKYNERYINYAKQTYGEDYARLYE